MANYRLSGRLSSGELYERHAGLAENGAPVSVLLFSERASDPKVVQALAGAAQRLTPAPQGVLAPLGVGMVRKRVVLIAPRVVGVTWQSCLARLQSRELLLQPPVTLAIVLEMLDALASAQERGAVHGALTPDAIHLDQELGIRVGDFGLGDAAQASPALRKLLWPKSREPYRAPESAQGQAPSDAVDVYSAAALAYELFTLHRPGGGDKPAVSSRREPPAPPSRLDRRINPRFDPVLLKALDYSPQRRWRSCQELAHALRTAASAVGGAAAASEVRKVAADLHDREADRTLGPPPWAEPFEVETLAAAPPLDRTEVAALLPKVAPETDPRFTRTQVEPQDISMETPQIDDAGWGATPDTISTVDDAARKGVLRPIRPAESDDDGPLRTAPMRPKGQKSTGPRGKGFMPSRAEPSSVAERGHPSSPGAGSPPPSPSPERSPLVARPQAAPATRGHKSPTLVVLLDRLRRRKRMFVRISLLSLLVAVAAAYGIQRMEKARREKEIAALFSGSAGGGDVKVPDSPPKPIPLPREIAGTPEYAVPAPEGAALLTVLSDVPAWVVIDGARLPKMAPVYKVPVPPGDHVILVMDATGTPFQKDLHFEVGKQETLDVSFQKRAAP